MHRVTQDDIYNGYHIPGGSTIVLNAWYAFFTIHLHSSSLFVRAILTDPDTYPDPDAFRPERFLTPSGELDPCAHEPTAAFGFGRRACAGEDMALDTLWIVVASLLWAFEVRRAVDGQGKEVDVKGEFTFGAVW